MTKQEKKHEVEIENTEYTEPKDNAQDIAQQYINKMKELEENAEQFKDQTLRALAEAENTRKRAEKEMEEAKKFALTAFVKDLINVIENLYRSTDHITEDNKKIEAVAKLFEGIELTQNEFMSVLEKYKVVRILPKKGEKFDHNYHQSISQLIDNTCSPNTIINVIQAGYVLQGRLLRPALVVVSSNG